MMADENPIRTQIVAKAREEFFTHGFSKVTTDELAEALGISKKTLYQHFSSKEELLRAAVYQLRDELSMALESTVDRDDLDFVEKLRTIMTAIGTRVSQLRQPFFEDIERKAPQIWKELEAFRREKIFTVMGKLFAQGSRSGMLRKDIDPQLFMLMFFAVVQQTINPESLSHLPYSASQVFDTLIKVLMEGVLTDEARAKFLRRSRQQQR
jgi:AcrR family transcriptional regulator